MLSAGGSFKGIAHELERSGYAVAKDFLDAPQCAALAAECNALYASAALLPAAVGRGGARQERADIRGDHTGWFEPATLTAAQSAYWQRMQSLRIELNQTILLGMDELEAHFALYPVGARYTRHRDRFRDDDARVLSSALYLNPDWHDDDGGALRLYADGAGQNPHVDIYPMAGTLALFLSADFEHEVLPARRERLSIAGWFRQQR
jgi:SM-20-related protein